MLPLGGYMKIMFLLLTRAEHRKRDSVNDVGQSPPFLQRPVTPQGCPVTWVALRFASKACFSP